MRSGKLAPIMLLLASVHAIAMADAFQDDSKYRAAFETLCRDHANRMSELADELERLAPSTDKPDDCRKDAQFYRNKEDEYPNMSKFDWKTIYATTEAITVHQANGAERMLGIYRKRDQDAKPKQP